MNHFFLVAFLVFQLIHVIAEIPFTPQFIEKIPVFAFRNLQNEIYTDDHLSKVHPILVIYFDPQCTYSIEAIHNMKKYFNEFMNIEILLVSPFNKEEVEVFVKDCDLHQFPNLNVLLDPKDKFNQYFQETSFPSFFVYNKSHEFVQSFTGDISINEIAGTIKKTMAP